MADLEQAHRLVVEIFNKNKAFHVKLYEKSPKRRFLMGN